MESKDITHHLNSTNNLIQNYSDYSRAELGRNPTGSYRFLTTFADQLLEGSLPRYVSPEVTWTRPKWTGEQRRALFQRLDEEPEQWETFSPYLAEQLTKVQRLMVQHENSVLSLFLLNAIQDFIEMLNFPTADQGTRDASFETGLISAADALNSINLEQHIESITSLESVSSFNMIWEDIDAAFQVEVQGSPEMVAFALNLYHNGLLKRATLTVVIQIPHKTRNPMPRPLVSTGYI